MSATEIVHEIESLPGPERVKTIKNVLQKLCPQSPKAIERLLRRIEHPEVPEDFWEGMEEIEDGKSVAMTDEHFDRPPV